jgi:AraC-like DNA-binding protein
MAFGFNQESVNGGLAQLVALFCQQQGLSIPAVCLHYQSSQRIPFTVWQDMLQQVNALYQQPALGLQIARLIQPAHIGIMGYLGLSCQTLGEALNRFERYHRLAYDCNALRIDLQANSLQDQSVEISWGTNVGKPGQLVDETAIALFKTSAEQLIDPEKLQLSHIQFVNPAPSDTTIYNDYFGCPVQFAADRTRICFSVRQLSLPIRRADYTLRQLLENQAAALLHELPEHDHFDQQLQAHMTQAVQQGNIQIDAIAAQLGLSARGLQRELAKRHYTFQQRLAQIRETLAKQYLLDHRLSLIDIALLLGYSEQSAFQRAFRQWTGQTPYQWRSASHP